MLISDKMVAAINKQIGNEFGAFLQYVAIAAYFGNESLPELAKHFNQQAMEERQHAMKFVNYVLDAGGLPETGTGQSCELDKPARHLSGTERALSNSAVDY